MDCYQKWTIAISAISALATFFAVIVALWQTKYANSKRLKLTNTVVAQLTQNASTGQFFKTNYLLLSVKIVNIGNREVVLNDWGVSLSKEDALQIVNINEKVFPCKIEVEQYKELKTTLEGLRNALVQNKDKICNIKQKLKIYVVDSTGRKYYTKMPYSVEHYMNLSDNEVII